MFLRQHLRRVGCVLAGMALAGGAVVGTAGTASAEYEYCGGDPRWPNHNYSSFCYVVFGSDYKAGPRGGDLNLTFEETVRLINNGSTLQIRGFAAIATSDGMPSSLRLNNDFKIRPVWGSVSVSTPAGGGGVSWNAARDGALSQVYRNSQRSVRLDYSSNNGVQIRKRAETTRYVRTSSASVEYPTVAFPLSATESIMVVYPWSPR